MRVSIPNSSPVACICEGGAETVIMRLLLDNDLLIFDQDQLISGDLIPRMSVREFEKRYLRVEYDSKVIVLRIIDSRNEQFVLSRAYRCQVDVINVITAPEIEMLIIASQNKYDEYKRSRVKKPSDYCMRVLNLPNVKSPRFIERYFSDSEFLLSSILEYHRIHKQRFDEASIFDLIKLK